MSTPQHLSAPSSPPTEPRSGTPPWTALGSLPGVLLSFLLFTIGAGSSASGASPVSPSSGDGAQQDFQPDPRTVQTYGPAYRYPQDGWTVLHIEGGPYQRGIQHGRLMAPEIAAYIRCLAASTSSKAPSDAWKLVRQLTATLMLRHYPKELLEEIQGIAEGANAAGARVDGRLLDATDIAAINAANELDQLGDAIKATATGTEALRPPAGATPAQTAPAARPQKRPHPTRCSAFAANGPATRDGKIVFGHITMYDLYPAHFYNVWADVVPSQGHRFVMQSTPGGIHSGMDYTLNAAGILLSETTIQQTASDPSGIPLAVRIRMASQYGDSIEKVAEFLTKDGNGLCSTEWILADIKRNEIALLTLGLKEHKLRRSSRQEWIEGAENFYWSCNNTKDRSVRLETLPGMLGRPSAAAIFEPGKRDALWLALYGARRGSIDEGFAREVLTTPALVSAFSADAVYTTSDLAARFQSRATFGPPVGGVRNPSFIERTSFPEIQPLVSNPWTTLHCGRPSREPKQDEEIKKNPPSDLHNPENPLDVELAKPQPPKRDPERETPPAWRGTLLSKNDADQWLPVAFANYERIVALEHELRKKGPNKELSPEHLEELGAEISYHRSTYELGRQVGGDIPLRELKPTVGNENWYRIASGKGTLLLHNLRAVIGSERFDLLMEDFGAKHAGTETDIQTFQRFLETGSNKNLDAFFAAWTEYTGLPQIRLTRTESRRSGKGWTTAVSVERENSGAPIQIPVTVVAENDEETNAAFVLKDSRQTFEVSTTAKPERITLNKYGTSPFENSRAAFTALSFDTEVEHTLIVAGTAGEEVANLESARILQTALRRREHNITIPIRLESEVSEEELRTHHILLIGRPACNGFTKRWENLWPVQFGSRSFCIRDEWYGHPHSAVVCAARNPLNPRFSIACIAGMGGQGTLRTAGVFEEENLPYAQVLVLPHEREIQALTAPDPEFEKVLR